MNPWLTTQVEFAGRRGSSLREVVGAEPVRWSVEGVRAAFGEVEANGDTCVAGARWTWCAAPPARGVGLDEALAEACARAPERAALALSGGVDSAVLAALLSGRVTAYTLETGLPGYCEAEAAAGLAARLGVPLVRVRVSAEELVEAIPAVIRGCETPLYNLHPVSRYLLARAVRSDGFDCLVTGDGADEVFRGATGADYLPIVGALTRAAGLTVYAPFLDAAVRGGVVQDADKRALRDLAEELGVPRSVAWRTKQPRFAPAMDLSRYWDELKIGELGRQIGLAPSQETDRARVGWTTLALFAGDYPGLERCAG